MQETKNKGLRKQGAIGLSSAGIKITILASLLLVLFIPLSIGVARGKTWPDKASVNLEQDDGIVVVNPRSPAKKPGTFLQKSLSGLQRFFDAILSVREPANRSPSAPTVWVDIFEDDFEGDFPGDWSVFDNNGTDYGEYYWEKSDCRVDDGSYSAWVIGGGADGSLLSCGADYPANAFSWMVYGPFSLADAIDAEFKFDYWLNSESGYDVLFAGASIDGSQFHGAVTSGVSDWSEHIVDLTDVYSLGDLTGEDEVWVALAFQSDSTVQRAEGVYVDDVVVRKDTSSTPPTPTNTETTPESTQTPAATATNTTTPASLQLNLPLLMKDHNNGPTWTPTITPTPSNTPVPPTPTNTPEPGLAMDGTWEGGNNQGDEITLTVTGNGTEVDVELFIYWDACGVYATQQNFNGLTVQSDGSFHAFRDTGTSVTELWGQFTSEITAEGNYEAEITPLFTSCLATKEADWTAVYVP
jgi:hypothetical protein